jgi:hypothetical protein
MTPVRPLYVPPPYQDSAEAGRLILRDGTTATIRPALLAVRNGFSRLWAVTQADNLAMLEVLDKSGFPARKRLDSGYVELDLSVQPTEAREIKR